MFACFFERVEGRVACQWFSSVNLGEVFLLQDRLRWYLNTNSFFPRKPRKSVSCDDQQILSAAWFVLELKGLCKSLAVYIFTAALLECYCLHSAVRRRRNTGATVPISKTFVLVEQIDVVVFFFCYCFSFCLCMCVVVLICFLI